jgi:hypothetical protein
MGQPSKLKTGPGRSKCPVCRSAAYSLGGIHPQCAEWRAGKALAHDQTVEAKPARTKWVKQCPRCQVALHVRRGKCDCGHSFDERLLI